MSNLRVINPNELKRNREIKNKERKRKRKWFSIFLIFFIAVMIYLVVNVARFGNSYSVYTVVRGKYEDSVTVDGYLFREQTVINAPASGYLNCYVSENERVASGETVAAIYNKTLDLNVSSQIKNIDAEIANLTALNIKDETYSSGGVKSEQRLAAEIREAVSYGYSKDFSSLRELSNSMIYDIRRNSISGAGGDTDNVDDLLLEDLKSQRESLISGNGIESYAITTEKAGVFSSKIDGFEDKLSIDKLDNIRPSYIKELDSLKASEENKAETGNPVCKVINNFEWYLAAVIPTDKTTLLEVNQEVQLRFFDITSNTVSGNITYISPDENGDTVVVIKSGKYVNSIYSMSRASVDIVKNKYSGLKVPIAGIRVVDNKTGVYVLRRGVAKFVNVDVIYNDGKWAVIKEGSNDNNGIKLYDELILNGKNLYDGKILK